MLSMIVLLGLGLRLWGIRFGLPYMYHPDEGVPVTIAIRMLQTGNFDPGFFHWSSLLFYSNALVYFVYFLVGHALGRFSSISDLRLPDVEAIAVGKAFVPGEFLLGRGLTVLFGTLAIVVAYFVCRKLQSARWVGWVAALWLAVETISVRNSQFIRPDAFVVFFELVTVWFCLSILDDPRWRNYLGAGIAAGLAASFKYNAAVICLPILVAHLSRYGARGLLRREIYAAAIVSIVAFVLTTPYAALDFSTFARIGPLQAEEIYATGHTGAEGDTFNWYLQFFWGTQGVVTLLALAEIGLCVARRQRREIVLLAFPLAYYGLINFYTVHFDETALPVIPFLIIFASLLLGKVFEFLNARSDRVALFRLASVLIVSYITAGYLRSTVAYNTDLLDRDARESARVWIDANLPPGARIAVEPYSPYIERDMFTVEGFVGMDSHVPEWYPQNGFEYLVFSSGSYERFFNDPGRYGSYIAQYDAFFNRYALVKQFDEGGVEIRIYKTDPVQLPSVRTAARWGIYEPWVELVGYDWRGPSLTLYWRTIEARREPLQLTARLLDANDRAVGQVTGPLFTLTTPGGKWLEGISLEKLTIPTPKDPGLYRLELAVETEGLGRISLLSADNQNISDKYYLERLEFQPVPPSPDDLAHSRPLNVRLGDSISLLSYTIRTDNSPRLTLYWQSVKSVTKDYTVFVHVLDSSGRIRGQIDRQPRNGTYPTSAWDAGGIIVDEYALPVDLAAGEYHIEVGMYEFPTLIRLPITDSNGNDLNDHLILPDAIHLGR